MPASPSHPHPPPDPSEWDRIVADRPGSILLETARPDAENSSTYLFTDPLQILEAHTLDDIPNVFALVDATLRSGHYVAGFVSYEAGYHFEPRALGATPFSSQPDLPLIWFGIYNAPSIATAAPCNPDPASDFVSLSHGDLAFDLSPAAYRDKINRIRRYIEQGDFYQANLTVKLQMPWREEATALFRRILGNQPVAYGAFFNLGDTAILSASPELFFRRHGSNILVRPMKGTAHRGRDNEEDAALSAWLADDEKNRAENVMIVDLLRNDLGRICAPGSVRVEDLFAIERYEELFQMTSTVHGELRAGTTYYQLFRALFPCGSITGAPKIRTMQVIRELEGEPRGIACGAIGFFAPDDTAIFSVAIRTLTLRKGDVQMRIGSGITWDSDPSAEFEECRLKARFLMHSPQHFELIETLLWDNGYFLLDGHLARLAASAVYFDFPCDTATVNDALTRYAASFTPASPMRVRLTLARSGAILLTSVPLQPSAEPATLLLTSHRTDPNDRFLRHKTTHRSLYDSALREAHTAGFDDALFLNQRGEITECAIHNVLIEKAGELITPPLDCGLLPGVYRVHLLATQPSIRQSILTLDDLLAAERIFLCNSVRGLRTVCAISLHPGSNPVWTAPPDV